MTTTDGDVVVDIVAYVANSSGCIAVEMALEAMVAVELGAHPKFK